MSNTPESIDSSGHGVPLAWADLPNATLVFKTSNYTALSSDYAIFCDSTAGTFAITLPASPVLGEQHLLIDSSGASSTNNVTIAGNGKNFIGQGGPFTGTLLKYAYGAISIMYNGTAWIITSYWQGA